MVCPYSRDCFHCPERDCVDNNPPFTEAGDIEREIRLMLDRHKKSVAKTATLTTAH